MGYFINFRLVQIDAFNNIYIYIKTTAAMSFISLMVLNQPRGQEPTIKEKWRLSK